MKEFFAYLLGSLFGSAILLLAFWLLFITTSNDYSNFVVSDNKVLQDLQGRYVIVPPGQAWGFSQDQKISLSILGKKPTEDGVIVSVKLNSVVNATKDQKAMQLDGIVKLNYESIGGEWLLVDLIGINLKVIPK